MTPNVIINQTSRGVALLVLNRRRAKIHLWAVAPFPGAKQVRLQRNIYAGFLSLTAKLPDVNATYVLLFQHIRFHLPDSAQHPRLHFHNDETVIRHTFQYRTEGQFTPATSQKPSYTTATLIFTSLGQLGLIPR